MPAKKKAKKKPLTFKELRKANTTRCDKHFHKLDKWSATDWGCSLAGEVGELCNFLKKMLRGEDIPLKSVAKEAGDVVCYLDLLCARLKIDLGEAVREKFNEVSDRKKSKIKL